MAIGKYTHGKLINIIKQTQTPHEDGYVPAGSDTHLQYNNDGAFGGISTFTFDGTDMKVADDTKIKFGTNSDAHMEYNENGDDFLVISGSANGIVLSGSTIQIAGTLEGASPLKIGGQVQFISDGADNALRLGPNGECKIYCNMDDSGQSTLALSGSAPRGVELMGPITTVSGKLGIGTANTNQEVTHGITLPDTSAPAGQVKANAFVSYSSIRYKENVEPLDSAVETISKLKGVSYNWKDTGKKDFGFIAEEVGKVLPEIVEWAQDPQYANTMDYTRIISFLVEAVKEQQKKIDILSEKIDKIGV